MSFDFALPLRQPDSPTETIVFLVEWGDGQSEVMTLEGGNNWNPAIYTHSYATDEAKTIKIYPLIGETFGKYWNFGSADAGVDRLKLKGISQWGPFQFDRSGGAFEGCSNLSFSSVGGVPSFGPAGDPPNSPNNALARAFKGCSSLMPDTSAFTDWNITNVNSLSETFSGCLNLNVNLGNWNVSNVRTTYRMFYNCPSINRSFAGWTNVSNLENMSEMFSGATNFAGEIFANWDSSDKTSPDISGMFKGTKFNGANVSTWDVSNISNFSSVFEGATLFNADIDDWDTGEGTNFYNMFNGATSFNRNISQWDTSKGTNFNSMFEGATIFNQNINPWTIRSDVAVTMDNMLNGASAFDQDISDWNMTNVSSAINLLDGTDLSADNAAAINDSGTGWPSQPGVSAAVTNESAAAQQASGTLPNWTSHSVISSGNNISNPENTQTTVNLTVAGSPTPTLSKLIGLDEAQFTLVDNGNGTGTLKLTNAPNYEGPTDSHVSGSNTYHVWIKASNSIGDSSVLFNFNVTDVEESIPAPTGDLVLSVDNSITGTGHGNTVDGPAGHHQVWYKGTYAPGADQLIIQASTSSDFTDTGYGSLLTLQASSANAEFSDWTVFSHVAMQAETEYYFRYQGKTNSGIESDWSATVGPLKTDVKSPGYGASYHFEVESFEANEDAVGNWGAGTGSSSILSTAAVHSPSDYWIPIRVKLKSSEAWSNLPHVKWEVLVMEAGTTGYSLQVPPNALANTAPPGHTWQIYDVTDEVNGVAGGGSRAAGGTGYPSTADLCLKPETQYSIKARMVWQDRPWESDEWIGVWVSDAGYARHIVGEDNEPLAAKEITITTPPVRSAPDVATVRTSTVYSWSAALIGNYSNGLPMGDSASFDDWRGDKKITFSFSRPGANGVRSFLWQLAVDPNFENLVAECGASKYWAGNHYFNDDDYSYQPGSSEGARLFLPTRNVGSIDVAKCYDLANGFLDGDWVTVDEGTTFELDWALQPATTYYFRTRCLPLGIHWDPALAASLGVTYPDAAGWSLETNPGSWGQGDAYGQYDDTGLSYARATTGTPAVISYASVHEGPMAGGGTVDTIFLYVLGFAMQNGTTITVQHYAGGNWNTVESWNTVIGHWHSGKTEIITGAGNSAGNNTDVNEAGETIGYPAVQRVRYGPRGGPIEWNSEPSENSYHVSRHYQFEGSNFSISAGDTMKIKVEHGGSILEEKEIIVAN